MHSVSPESLKDNVFKLISQDWMLITAGDRTKFNTMTANWAGLGFLWYQPVSFCFVRPQRYTFEFMEKSACYTLSLFTEQHRDALSLCGSQSGRDLDKVQAAGLTPETIGSVTLTYGVEGDNERVVTVLCLPISPLRKSSNPPGKCSTSSAGVSPLISDGSQRQRISTPRNR